MVIRLPASLYVWSGTCLHRKRLGKQAFPSIWLHRLSLGFLVWIMNVPSRGECFYHDLH